MAKCEICGFEKILVSLDLSDCGVNYEDGMTEREIKEAIKDSILDSLEYLKNADLIYTCARCGHEVKL